jgi:TM2 domain-containing membrane protein YozV
MFYAIFYRTVYKQSRPAGACLHGAAAISSTEKTMYSTFIAYLLWALGGFGVLGLQRFYLRKIPTGFLWLFTGGLGFIGAVYDFFTLGEQVRIANLKAGYRDAIYGRGRETIIIRDGYSRDGYNSAPRDVPKAKDTIEKVILRTARKNGGLVSPGEVAIESDFTSDSARDALEKMAGKGMCEMRVRPSGVIVFRFPEFAPDDTGFEPGL